jgi:NitT/TauT family transport system ATP-binding protein
MVFQDLGLFPWMTVIDNVAFGLEMLGMGRAERHARAEAFLTRVGLGGFLRNYPHELSGGMRQRAAILRAFLVDSPVLLMDEPFGALDSQTRLVMQEELLHIWKEHKRTILYVTHDIEEAILMGDEVIVMSGRPGTIRQIIPINIERPRQLADRNHPELADLRLQIWRMLEDEVRRDLKIAV